MGRQGGDSDFSDRGGGKAIFASGGGKGYCKMSIIAVKMHFLKKVLEFCSKYV